MAFRTLPISPEDADELMDDIRAKAILNGVRGMPAVDRQKVKTLMLRLSDIAMAYPEIVEIDLNPVIVNSDGYSVVDARMMVKQQEWFSQASPRRAHVAREKAHEGPRPPSPMARSAKNDAG